jgi:hypothetical protein
MIGKIKVGKSFAGCISYCLNDKRDKLSNRPVTKGRAELLMFNKCGGNERELIRQFNEVRELNPKLSKPVMHITLSFPKDDYLSKEKLISICADCAKKMGFENNQFIAATHNDTDHQHLHIAASRIGFDKRTVSDSNSYKKIAAFCRETEVKYGLKQVLSPKKYLSKELKELPRFDARKEILRNNIQKALLSAKNLNDFFTIMKEKNYAVIKGRGIAFIDDKKVKTKGSEVGYSLQNIEKILSLKSKEKQRMLKQKEGEQSAVQNQEIGTRKVKSAIRPSADENRPQSLETAKEFKQHNTHDKQQSEAAELLELLLKPEQQIERINPNLLQKKKRKRRHLHL